MEDIEHRLEVSVPSTADHIPVFMDLESFDMNGDGNIDEDEERMAQFALSVYFQQRRISHRLIIPALRRHIRQDSDSPIEHAREGVLCLRRMMSGQHINPEDRPLRYLQDLVLNATTETLQQTEEEAIRSRREADKRITKRTAIIMNSVVGLAGLAAALIVHFTQGNCS